MHHKSPLAIAYDKIEAELAEPPSKNREHRRLWREWRRTIRTRCLAEGVNDTDYGDRLREADDILRSVRGGAVNPERILDEDKSRVIWAHRDLPLALETPEISTMKIDKDWLEQEAARYLARPYLQHDEIDWVIMDSLIYAETSAFRE